MTYSSRSLARIVVGPDDAPTLVLLHGITSSAGSQAAATLKRLGIDPDRPTIVFVGRITRQKGLPHLLRACEQLPADVQVILCAGAPDTPEIKAEVEGLVARLREKRTGVVWIEEMLPRPELIAVLAASDVFVCPSVYEPLGIVNLEAMAVGLPVVGSATGGIPDVIVDGETGLLVPIEQVQDGTGTPIDPARFEADLAERLITLVTDTEAARTMGQAARRRVEEHFAWEAIAQRTMDVYNWVPAPRRTGGGPSATKRSGRILGNILAVWRAL